jgi:hypothetical protein
MFKKLMDTISEELKTMFHQRENINIHKLWEKEIIELTATKFKMKNSMQGHNSILEHKLKKKKKNQTWIQIDIVQSKEQKTEGRNVAHF